MFGLMELFASLYSILIISIFGFILFMIFRFVKAFEKIASAYEKKNK
jgi:hypothetical protein